MKNKMNVIVDIILGIFFVAGMTLITLNSGFETAAGIFLIMWANNYDYIHEKGS